MDIVGPGIEITLLLHVADCKVQAGDRSIARTNDRRRGWRAKRKALGLPYIPARQPCPLEASILVNNELGKMRTRNQYFPTLLLNATEKDDFSRTLLDDNTVKMTWYDSAAT
jgi:hypothetical protein